MTIESPETLTQPEAGALLPPATGSVRYVTKSTLPKNKDWPELAEDLLSRFPGIDRAALLKKMVARQFYDMRFGNKREERAACEFLNLLQVKAFQMTQDAQAPNAQAHRQPPGPGGERKGNP